jgi:hypothetical protein
MWPHALHDHQLPGSLMFRGECVAELYIFYVMARSVLCNAPRLLEASGGGQGVLNLVVDTLVIASISPFLWHTVDICRVSL